MEDQNSSEYKNKIENFIKEVYKIIDNNPNIFETQKKELVKKEVERRVMK